MPAKSKELQIRFRFIVRDRTTFNEQIIERLFPIRLLANPGRDCKDLTTRPSYIKRSTWNSLLANMNAAPGMIPASVILGAVDDDEIGTQLTEDEKVAFCEGKILLPFEVLNCQTFYFR